MQLTHKIPLATMMHPGLGTVPNQSEGFAFQYSVRSILPLLLDFSMKTYFPAATSHHLVNQRNKTLTKN